MVVPCSYFAGSGVKNHDNSASQLLSSEGCRKEEKLVNINVHLCFPPQMKIFVFEVMSVASS